MALTSIQALAKVNALYAQLTIRRRETAKLNRYFVGEQPLAYASDEWRTFHQDRFGNFADNWCGVVGNSPSERIRVNGFRVGDDADIVSDDEKQLMRDWHVNEMDAQSSQGFLQSIVAKRSSVIVWGDENDEPVNTWETPAQVIVEYDPESPRERLSALKAWVDNDHENATLYLKDEVWKFQRTRVAGQIVNGQTPNGLYLPGEVIGVGGWKPRQPRSDDTWPISNPLNLVPVVEFLNRPMLGGDALSDIAGTIAMQDAINLLWAYLFAAADYASMPARVIMGQEPPKIPILDADGQKVGEKQVALEQLQAGRLLWLTGQNTKVDQFESAKLDVFTSVINVSVKHVAAQTRTPVHYIVGELGNVNGETLVASESGLVKKVEEFQLFAGPAAREVFRLNALVRGRTDLADACRTGRVQWADAETRTTAQASDAALKDRQIGFPIAWIAEKRFGMSQDEIARLVGMIEAEDSTLNQVMRGLSPVPAVDAGPAGDAGAADGGTGGP